jgi:hypothetical protein
VTDPKPTTAEERAEWQAKAATGTADPWRHRVTLCDMAVNALPRLIADVERLEAEGQDRVDAAVALALVTLESVDTARHGDCKGAAEAAITDAISRVRMIATKGVDAHREALLARIAEIVGVAMEPIVDALMEGSE